MKYTIDGWNNFCRVFELPKTYSSNFCFGDGIATNFQMQDWFNPVSDLPQPAVSKKFWEENVGPIDQKEVDYDNLVKSLTEFLAQKSYVKSGYEYLVICNFGMAFTFKPDHPHTPKP